jgi:hypothetical protein
VLCSTSPKVYVPYKLSGISLLISCFCNIMVNVLAIGAKVHGFKPS